MGKYDDEYDREGDYKNWSYYRESAYEDRAEKAESINQPSKQTVDGEGVSFPVVPSIGPLPVIKERSVFSSYPKHAAMVRAAEEKFFSARKKTDEDENTP